MARIWHQFIDRKGKKQTCEHEKQMMQKK